MSTKTTQMPTDEAFADFGKLVAARMGANTEWDSAADYLDDFASAAEWMLGVSIGGQSKEELILWRGLADQIGVPYDADVEDVEDAEEHPGQAL